MFNPSEMFFLYVQNDILASLDAGYSTILHLDYLTAFDPINHNI